MSAPTTYLEWTNLLDKFSSGDDKAIDELSLGSFTLDAGTAARFCIKIEEVYKKRKQLWLDKFQRSFEFHNFKTENDFEIALRNGKQNLSPLRKFVELNGIPKDLQKTLKKDLEDFVAEIKKSLKDNLSKSSSGREKMLLIINKFDFNDNSNTILANTSSNINQSTVTTGRKIIF
jgi:hypothetical protein